MADLINYQNPGPQDAASASGNNPAAPTPNSGAVPTDSSAASSAASNNQPATPANAPAAASPTAEFYSVLNPPKPNPSELKDEKVLANTLSKINLEAQEKATQEKAQTMGMNYIEISKTPINPDLLKLIEPKIARQNFIMPFFRVGKKLRLTVAHPTDPGTRAVINDLKQQGYLINVNLSSEPGILEALKLYETEQYIVKKQIDTRLDETKIKTYEKELAELAQLGERLKSVNSEEAVYMICIGALKAGSSDVHLESEETFVRARYRIDGVLHEAFTLEKAIFNNIANQIKYQAKVKVNVNDVPQDGRFDFKVNDRKIDVRVSVLPTEYGESFVFRLLDSSRQLVSFEELGYSGTYLRKMENLSKISHGMVLMTGPTGSGKTTSLYTLLSKFNHPENKIITLEDPIEYHLPGITQSQINEKGGYTFASGLRSVLRQDPQVVMIGEIRDLPTAETAAQAALTGHVLLSTLHTNSAIETIPRLINIGLPAFMVAPALHTIIGQRLARQICPHCKVMKPVPEAERKELQQVVDAIQAVRPAEKLTVPAELPEAPGCEKCSHSGYKGRVTLVEMLEVDFEIKDLILNNASTTKMIEAARRKGMITMREDGILKVLKGITTLEEVHRVTSIN